MLMLSSRSEWYSTRLEFITSHKVALNLIDLSPSYDLSKNYLASSIATKSILVAANDPFKNHRWYTSRSHTTMPSGAATPRFELSTCHVNTLLAD